VWACPQLATLASGRPTQDLQNEWCTSRDRAATKSYGCRFYDRMGLSGVAFSGSTLPCRRHQRASAPPISTACITAVSPAFLPVPIVSASRRPGVRSRQSASACASAAASTSSRGRVPRAGWRWRRFDLAGQATVSFRAESVWPSSQNFFCGGKKTFSAWSAWEPSSDAKPWKNPAGCWKTVASRRLARHLLSEDTSGLVAAWLDFATPPTAANQHF